jgi:gliding motility-associated-like protein
MTVSNIQTSCNGDNTVKLTFDVTGGDNGNYTVTTLTGVESPSGTFTVDNLAENVDHSFGVADGTSCNYIIGESSGARSCSCPEEVNITLKAGEPNTICNDGTTTDLEITLGNIATTAGFEIHKNGVIYGTAYTTQTNGSLTVSVSDTGTYTIANYTGSCPGSTLGNVKIAYIPTTLITTQAQSPTAFCENIGNINLSVTATGDNLSYQWKKGGIDIASATNAAFSISNAILADAGDYTVEITGTCGTTTSNIATVTINENTATIPGFTAGISTSCENGIGTFTIAPVTGTNVQYTWSVSPSLTAPSTTTSETITFGNQSNYTITVTATGDCGSPQTNDTVVNITGSETLSFDLSQATGCQGDPLTISVSNLQGSGASPTFDWSATTPANDGSTTKDLQITAATNSSTATVTVTSNSACITGTNPLTKSITISTHPLVTATITTECHDVNNSLSPTEFKIRAKVLTGDLATISITERTTIGGITWTQDGADEWISSAISEVNPVDINVTDQYDCSGGYDNPSPIRRQCSCPSSVAISSTAVRVCPGTAVNLDIKLNTGGSVGPFDVTVTGPKGYTNTSNTTVDYSLSVIEAGNYQITAFNDNANNCGTPPSTTVTIKNYTEVTANLTLVGTDNKVCANGTVERTMEITMTGEADYTLTYNDGSSNQTLTTSDNPYLLKATQGATYTLISISDKNCTGTIGTNSNQIIAEEAVPTISLNTLNATVCAGKKVNLTATPSPTTATIKWYSVPLGSSNPTLSGPVLAQGTNYQASSSGIYIAAAEVGGMPSCIGVALSKVEIIDIKITSTSYAPNPVELGKNLTLTATVEPVGSYSYNWTIDNTAGATVIGNPATYSTQEEGKHMIYLDVLENTIGCVANATVGEVTVFAPVLIPNVFTPNGDEVGDSWQVTGMKSFESTVRIYNRWGNLVYESFLYTEPWDGTFKGKDSPMGTYYYIIEITDKLYEGEREFQGQIQLLR